MSKDNIIPMAVWNDRWKREDLLTTRPRIRRPTTVPDCFARELSQKRRYPYRLTGLPPGYEAIYRRGGWEKIDTPQIDEPGFEDLYVRLRTTFAWVLEGDRKVAAVQLREIDAELVADWCFWEAMDAHSQDLTRWAEVILSLWPPLWIELFGYGPVLEIENVWVEPRHPRPGIWKPVAHALADRIMRKSSILTAHVFPEEYNGRVPRGARTEPAFDRRRDAMMRVCEREFGLKPMPHWGKDGFMWRPRAGLERIVGKPEYRPNWEE
ncbi:hypothetical protein [Phenylobacterium koreense]|uniref:N-acetyltransferase n=1 Tax=Phenylobacterium koreense TaxID=266125 RepID=A0ABV2EGM7_9CAUL